MGAIWKARHDTECPQKNLIILKYAFKSFAQLEMKILKNFDFQKYFFVFWEHPVCKKFPLIFSNFAISIFINDK